LGKSIIRLEAFRNGANKIQNEIEELKTLIAAEIDKLK